MTYLSPTVSHLIQRRCADAHLPVLVQHGGEYKAIIYYGRNFRIVPLCQTTGEAITTAARQTDMVQSAEGYDDDSQAFFWELKRNSYLCLLTASERQEINQGWQEMLHQAHPVRTTHHRGRLQRMGVSA